MTHLVGVWVSAVLPLPSVPPTPGRKSSRRAICNTVENKGCMGLSYKKIRLMRNALGGAAETRELDNKSRLFLWIDASYCGTAC